MGEPLKIIELAKRMVRLSGMELKDKNNPSGDIEIEVTGLRPGEKLYEELLIGENVQATSHNQIFRAKEDFIPWPELKLSLDLLKEIHKNYDEKALGKILREVVYGFNPQEQK